jgi:hypothetical protein
MHIHTFISTSIHTHETHIHTHTHIHTQASDTQAAVVRAALGAQAAQEPAAKANELRQKQQVCASTYTHICIHEFQVCVFTYVLCECVCFFCVRVWWCGVMRMYAVCVCACVRLCVLCGCVCVCVCDVCVCFYVCVPGECVYGRNVCKYVCMCMYICIHVSILVGPLVCDGCFITIDSLTPTYTLPIKKCPLTDTAVQIWNVLPLVFIKCSSRRRMAEAGDLKGMGRVVFSLRLLLWYYFWFYFVDWA